MGSQLLNQIVGKSTRRFTKSPCWVLIRLVLTEVQRFKKVKINKNVWLSGRCVQAASDSVRMAIHFFVNFDIFKGLYLAYYWVYLHQTWGFVKLGLQFMTVWINSSNPIICRLVPSPSRLGNRQSCGHCDLVTSNCLSYNSQNYHQYCRCCIGRNLLVFFCFLT